MPNKKRQNGPESVGIEIQPGTVGFGSGYMHDPRDIDPEYAAIEDALFLKNPLPRLLAFDPASDLTDRTDCGH